MNMGCVLSRGALSLFPSPSSTLFNLHFGQDLCLQGPMMVRWQDSLREMKISEGRGRACFISGQLHYSNGCDIGWDHREHDVWPSTLSMKTFITLRDRHKSHAWLTRCWPLQAIIVARWTMKRRKKTKTKKRWKTKGQEAVRSACLAI